MPQLQPYAAPLYLWERLREKDINGETSPVCPAAKDVELRPHQGPGIEVFRAAAGDVSPPSSTPPTSVSAKRL